VFVELEGGKGRVDGIYEIEGFLCEFVKQFLWAEHALGTTLWSPERVLGIPNAPLRDRPVLQRRVSRGIGISF